MFRRLQPFLTSITVTLVLFQCTTATEEQQFTWEVRKGVDNSPAHDLLATGTSDVEALKHACATSLYCKGFSSFYGTLKWSLDDLGAQPNTDLYVKVPSPPAFPPSAPFHVWPMVSHYKNGSNALRFDNETFSFFIDGVSSLILENAVSRYRSIVCPIPVAYNNDHHHPRRFSKQTRPSTTTTTTTTSSSSSSSTKTQSRTFAGTLTACSVFVRSRDDVLHKSNDESYQLSIPELGGQARITANTVWGALRALETFVQLVEYNWNGECWLGAFAPLNISDAPHFPYRGLMIDTSRHFLPVEIILTHLEAMSAAKMNALHWHITDANSFPLLLKSLPRLAEQGAFDPVRAIYTVDDVQEVIAFAYERGIRVIPEFDMPGHSSSWILGYPKLQGSATCPIFDPSSNYTYEIVETLIDELVEIFPDEVIHLGGDEVNFDCWNNSASIRAWMKQHNFTTVADVDGFWVSKIHDVVVKKHKKQLMLWCDMVDLGADVPKDVIIEKWNAGLDSVDKLALQGYETVYEAPFSLNILSMDWAAFYATSVSDGSLSGEAATRVIGAEAAMWGEVVDQTNAIAQVWPRAAALAEVLWTSEVWPKIAPMQASRLHSWRCRILQRGVLSSPIGNYPGAMHCGPL